MVRVGDVSISQSFDVCRADGLSIGAAACRSFASGNIVRPTPFVQSSHAL